MNAPLILSGPSGVGKTYLEKYLIAQYNFARIQSTITRQIRPGEISGVDYELITEEEYARLDAQGAFVTSQHAVGAYRGLRSLTTRSSFHQQATVYFAQTLSSSSFSGYPE